MLKHNDRETSLEVQWSIQKGQRQNQQDKIGWTDPKDVNERGVLFILSDGMGGMKNGERYARIAVEQMEQRFLATYSTDKSMKSILLDCYAQARKSALDACPDPQNPDGGATVVAVFIKRDRCMFLSVGDSKLYLWRNNGLIQLNREQTTGVLLDTNAAFGYIPKAYTRSSIRNTLDNNLCEAEEKEPDTPAVPFKLADEDLILLMSDGITHTLNDAELSEVLKSRGKADIAEKIENAVKDKKDPDQDNYSIIAIRIHNHKNR